jgi:outer membrane protein TolC
MKIFMVAFFLIAGNYSFSQSLAKMPDSVRRMVDGYTGAAKTGNPSLAGSIPVDGDAVIKEKLVKLALKNAQMAGADANVKIAEIARKKANSSMLNSISVGGNINEFVVNNSPSANFFPKYNAGLSVPLDLFAKNRAEKNTANQTIIINKALREQVEANLKARVLIQYELYKEKKELVELQKIAMEDDLAAYERAQKDFKEDAITLEELNKIYKASIAEKAYLATKERDLNIAVIQMEEIIGVPLKTALQK